MATQLKHTDFAYNPPPTVRVAFQPRPILPAVAAKIATLPPAIRSATLDELHSGIAQITSMAQALIAKAGEVLSPRMYRAFLRWGEAAIHSNTLCGDDDECVRRSELLGQAVRRLAATDAQHEQDGLIKAYLIALEVGDAPGFGPMEGDATSSYSVDKLAVGLSGDLPWLSPLAGMVNELSAAAWALSPPSAYSLAVGEAMLSAFRAALEQPGPLKLEGYDPFMRGPLIQWQKAYDRYEQAADELAAFDRDVHTPAAAAWTATSEALVDGTNPASVAAEAAACADLDVAQASYDNLCSARYDALFSLMRVPAPGPGELAIKLRLFSSDYGWTGGDEQRVAGEQITVDARRFGRLGAHVQTDQPLLDAFAEYRERYGDLRALPDEASISAEEACFARMDEACDPLCKTRATTIEGVIARLRFGLHGVNRDAHMPDIVLDPASERFKTGMPLADLSVRMIWQSIEDLARIAGVSLTERVA